MRLRERGSERTDVRENHISGKKDFSLTLSRECTLLLLMRNVLSNSIWCDRITRYRRKWLKKKKERPTKWRSKVETWSSPIDQRNPSTLASSNLNPRPTLLSCARINFLRFGFFCWWVISPICSSKLLAELTSRERETEPKPWNLLKFQQFPRIAFLSSRAQIYLCGMW